MPADRSCPRWYETRFCGSPSSSVSSPTRRSLRASSVSRRQRCGSAISGRISGGASVLATPETIHQLSLMDLGWARHRPLATDVVANRGGDGDPPRRLLQVGPVEPDLAAIDALAGEAEDPRVPLVDDVSDGRGGVSVDEG